ncbi:conserved hypothetical protein [Lebetimonas natsushimae]|uniref:Pentapeptide repeat-containing protein n=1 Tax=Lebetimonas natsushimae TaxID=1936991 RepID=A0A292YF98_9BACT|nr:hypothetical protein [Lebetimonas natsushimae]GAX87745.1 conserved hypothetical protein [Lebetimonas natsushimae]
MSYSVIYLDGTNGLPFKECEVCKKIKRNVIEPVAVFVPKEKENEYKEKFKILSEEKLQKELENLYKNTKWYKKNSKNFATCIFHCEKENEIWMENFNDGYEEYAKRRDEIISKKESFNENFEIKWNEFLVAEFWKRIRAYRFAVDYIELWEKETNLLKFEKNHEKYEENVQKYWNNFLKNLKNKEFVPSLDELKKNKELILFNFENLSNKSKEYAFQNIIFPKFFFYYFNKNYHEKNINFFYSNEKWELNNKINIHNTIFKDNCNFSKITINNTINISNTIFNKDAYFTEMILNGSFTFNNINLANIINFQYTLFKYDTQFINLTCNIISFKSTKFEKKIFFIKSTIHQTINFKNTKFYDLIYLEINSFNSIIFENNIFKQKVFLDFKENKKCNCNYNYNFTLKNTELKEENKIIIRNLKTVNLIIEEINNSTDNFFFYNTKIINLEEYKNYLNKNNFPIDKNFIKNLKSNISIVNSHLNKMKFINCDFSNAKNIHIEDSDLTEVKFINTEWGKISEKRICPALFEEKPKKARETYRQLKYALDNQKDHINANEFFSLEMKAYGKSLKWNNWQDKIIFTINKWTSDFGQNWIKPLIWIFISTLTITYLSLFKNWQNLLQFTFKEIFPLIPAIIFLIFINVNSNEKGKFKNLLFVITNILFILGFTFAIYEQRKWNIFDDIANIFNVKKQLSSNKHIIIGYKFLYLLYTILLSFFIYQFIIAVKRKTKR